MTQNYNYKEELEEDIAYYLTKNNIVLTRDNYDDVYDDMFAADCITGKGIGSYTFSSELAKQNVFDNLALCKEACEEKGITASEFGNKIYNEEFEQLDVIIRCYLLGIMLLLLNNKAKIMTKGRKRNAN